MLLLTFLFVGLLVLWSLSFTSFVGELCFLSYDLGGLGLYFMLDEVSCVCLFMLLCCGGIALFYCFHYFSGDKKGSLLFPLVVGFLGVMGGLVLSASPFMSLVFWEYLGLVSFFLILFYSKMSSLRASLITLFASRFGDAALFVLIMWFCNYCDFSGFVFGVLFVLIVITKSACFPFVSWLLEAMRAPTPVSSLVHSSTLVAAGVWFMFRYNWMCGSGLYWSVVCFCFVTIIMTAISAVVFMDLKKMVALSTCNKVSWCLLFFILGDLDLALLQLLTHGVCKCYLFMSVGDLMSQSGSSQSSVGVYLSRYSGYYSVFIQGFLVLSLSGIPFLGVFFSKHGLFSVVLSSVGVGLFMVLGFCLFLTYVYSVRFCLLLMGSLGGISLGYSSSFLLISSLVFLGSLLKGMWSFGLTEVSCLSKAESWLVLFLQVFGCLCGYYLHGWLLGGGSWSSLLWGSEGYVSSIYRFFLSVSSVCVISFYRWEVYLLSSWGRLGGLFSIMTGSVLSLNMLMLGVLSFLFLSFVFY